jgi:hypothetical protein
MYKRVLIPVQIAILDFTSIYSDGLGPPTSATSSSESSIIKSSPDRPSRSRWSNVRIISSSSLDVRDTGAVEVVFLMVVGAGLARVEVAVVVIGLRMAATVAGLFGMVDDARVLGGDGLEGARDDAVERAATVGSRLVTRGAMVVVVVAAVVVREAGTPGVFFSAKLTAERARAIG